MKRLARLLLVASLLYGTGAHWAAVQGVAWGKMIADRVATEGLDGAVTSTFSGKTPCGVCIVVDKGARAEQPARAVHPSVHFIAAGPVPAPALVLSARPVSSSAGSSRTAPRRPDSPPPKAALLA